MKKLFLMTAIAVFGFTTAQGQISFGAKAGANFASINGEDADDVDGRTDFHVGGVVNIGINEWFSIQPEVLYSGQGFSVDDEEDFEVAINYLNIPIMADFKIAEGLSLQGGPQIGFNMGSKFKLDGEDVDDSDLDDSINGFDFSTAIGAQYRLPMGLFFQARYVIGVTDVIEDVDASNSVVTASVGWFFN